jgi:hypothetical protein
MSRPGCCEAQSKYSEGETTGRDSGRGRGWAAAFGVSRSNAVRRHETARIYFELEAERSLVAVTARLSQSGPNQAPGKEKVSRSGASGAVKFWCRRWEWVERALAFDARIDAQRQQAVEEAARKVALEWQERDMGFRERRWKHSQAEMTRCEKMLEFPLATVTTSVNESPDGRVVKTTVVKPARWSFDTVGRLSDRATNQGLAALRNEDIFLQSRNATPYK